MMDSGTMDDGGAMMPMVKFEFGSGENSEMSNYFFAWALGSISGSWTEQFAPEYASHSCGAPNPNPNYWFQP